MQTVQDTENVEDNIDGIENTTRNTSPPSTPSVSRSSSRATSTTSLKRKTNDRSDEVLDIIAKSLQSNTSAGTQPVGRYTSYGQHVAQELSDLPQEMAMYCKKIINEALFQAQLGNLSACSRIVNDPQPIPTTMQREIQPVNTLQGSTYPESLSPPTFQPENQPVNTLQGYTYPESLNPPTTQPENQPVNAIQHFNYPESPQTGRNFYSRFLQNEQFNK